MAQQFRTPTLFSDAGQTFINHIVYISIVVATFDPSDCVRLCRMQLPINHSIFNHLYVCHDILKQLLEGLHVPSNFFIGHDCDMVPKLSARLWDSVLNRPGVHINYFRMFVMVFETQCCYNLVATPFCFQDDQLPEREFVQSMACDGGEHSLPAGATTLEKFVVQDEEYGCAICIKDFNSGDDAARLPCTHVFHRECILQWFAQKISKSACPSCRFSCSCVS